MFSKKEAIVILALVTFFISLISCKTALEDTNVVFKITGHVFGYPDSYNPVAATFTIYVDDSYIMDLAYNGYAGINTSFAKTLSEGTHKVKFLLASAAREKVSPSMMIEYHTSGVLTAYPPAEAIDYQFNFIKVGDSFYTSFELKKSTGLIF